MLLLKSVFKFSAHVRLYKNTSITIILLNNYNYYWKSICFSHTYIHTYLDIITYLIAKFIAWIQFGFNVKAL